MRRTQAATRKAQDESFYNRQRELLGRVVAESDVVITAAVIPGKKSPVLVTREMVEGMAPGSVIVDLAAERGGNCELTQPRRKVRNAVRCHDHRLGNVASSVPASRQPDVCAQHDGLSLHLVKEGKPRSQSADDEIIRGTLAHARRRNGERARPRIFRICRALASHKQAP